MRVALATLALMLPRVAAALLAPVTYHGVARFVEPYSLRMPKTGNLLLCVFEVRRGAGGRT